MNTLDRLAAIHDAATKGPFWTCHFGSYDHVNAEGQDDPVAIVPRCADATFIATARNTYAALLEVARAADWLLKCHADVLAHHSVRGMDEAWVGTAGALAALDAVAKEAV